MEVDIHFDSASCRALVPDCIHKFRVKRWRSLVAADNRWCIFVRLFDARLFGLVCLNIWDRLEKQAYGFTRYSLGSPAAFGAATAASLLRYRGLRKGIEFKVGAPDQIAGAASALEGAAADCAGPLSTMAITAFDVPRRGPSITCRIQGALPNNADTHMLLPLRGELVLGDAGFSLDEEATGFWEHKAVDLPFRHESNRLFGFGRDASGVPAGFCLTNSSGKGQRPGDNVLLLNGKSYSLPQVKITQPYGPDKEWIIQDTEGMVDLVFKPEAPHNTALRVAVVALDFREPFGSLEGFVKNDAGDRLAACALYGRGESQFLRI